MDQVPWRSAASPLRRPYWKWVENYAAIFPEPPHRQIGESDEAWSEGEVKELLRRHQLQLMYVFRIAARAIAGGDVPSGDSDEILKNGVAQFMADVEEVRSRNCSK